MLSRRMTWLALAVGLCAACGGGGSSDTALTGDRPRHVLRLQGSREPITGTATLRVTMEKTWPHPVAYTLEISRDGGESFGPATYEEVPGYRTVEDGLHLHRLRWDSRADLGEGVWRAILRLTSDFPVRRSNSIEVTVTNPIVATVAEAAVWTLPGADALVAQLGDQASFSEGHLERAVLLEPGDSRLERPGSLLLLVPRSADDDGAASRVASEALLAGWEPVVVLDGGIEAWVAEGRYLVVEEPEVGAALIDAGAAVLDLRGPEAFSAGHLPGARTASLEGMSSDPESAVGTSDRTRVVLLYGSGAEADGTQEAAALLEEAGFRTVRRFAPGWEGWTEAGGPIE